MAMIRWRRNDPFFSQIASLQDQLNRQFENAFGETGLAQGEVNFVPALDVSETADGYTVRAEIPGIEKDQIDISLTGNTLTLKGEKKQETETNDERWHRIERTYGTFTRTVDLPETIDPEKVNAKHRDGVLTVTIGKSEATQPRKISIQS